MADPSVVLSERFAGALASLDEALRGADPVVRRSDRADYQVNGSMALAKRTGRPPRDLAQDLIDRVELADIAHPPEVAELFNLMEHAVRRMDTIVRRLLVIARRDEIHRRPVDVHEPIRSAELRPSFCATSA